jgi:hypothetical protein
MKIIIIFVIGIVSLLNVNLYAFDNVPTQPAIARVESNQLIVEKRLSDGSLATPQSYIIKGVTWQPATRAPAFGPNPLNPQESVPYGFFFDWPGRNPPGYVLLNYWVRNQFKEYLTDIPLMKQMNVNTVRVYSDFGNDPQSVMPILDEFYRNGIMIIMTVAISQEEIINGKYLDTVRMYKDHPSILMWSLGNEWNLAYNLYYGYPSVSAAAGATNQASLAIKAIDQNHPVSSCLGDRFDDADPLNTIAQIGAACPDVDVWGINVYRGYSFGSLFTQWKSVTLKPFYLSEFGADSFRTENYAVLNGYQAYNTAGFEDQHTQALTDVNLWNEISNNLSAAYPDSLCVGGIVHEFHDSLWKVGNYGVSLGGLVNYNGPDGIPNTADDNTSYNAYNSEGFLALGSQPDNIANEEYFGVVDADRTPKEVFGELRNCFQRAPALSLGSVSPDSGTTAVNFTYTVVYTDLDNEAPQTITVDVDGATYAMAKQDPADLNYADGCAYIYTKQGLTKDIAHTYQFSANDGTSPATGDTSAHTGPAILNSVPLITYFSPSNVSPSINRRENVYFMIEASDADNDSLSYRFTLDGIKVSDSNTYTYFPGYRSRGQHTVIGTVTDSNAETNIRWQVTVTDGKPIRINARSRARLLQGNPTK